MYSNYLTPKDIFYDKLTGYSYFHIDDNFKYYIKSNEIGPLILKFKLEKNDNHYKYNKFHRISTNDLMLDAFFIHCESNEKDIQYSEDAIRKYIFDQGFNTINNYNIKYINFTDLLKKIVSHPTVNPDNLDCKIKIRIRRTTIYSQIIAPNNYIYNIPLNTIKKLISIEQIKPTATELFNDIKFFFDLYKKIEDVGDFLSDYGFHSNTRAIDKNKLKAFATFYNNFDKHCINKHIQNIDRLSLNRLLTLIEKIGCLITRKQQNPVNFTVKGIKIISSIKYNKSIFEIPLFNSLSFDDYGVEFLYAYLSSTNEFDSLIYKFEREYLSSV